MILIAEIILQRSKAEQVVPAYVNFIRDYPHIQLINETQEKKINRLFSPLGVTYRARRLIHTCRYILENYKGCLPKDRKDLLSILGVGEYIADALLVFVYDEKRTIIDSNIVGIRNIIP